MLSVGEIKGILKQEHLALSKRRGQNFLICGRIQRKIIDAIGIEPDDLILEIGPGLGALTEDLAEQAAKVLAVEKDKGLVRVLLDRLSRHKNLQIVQADILQFEIERFTKKRVKVVGNLPYYITTPIIGYLLEKQRKMVKEIFITVQHELARRLVAQAGTKDYSALTVLVQYFTKPKLLFSISKRAFYPQPKVDSVFAHLQIFSHPCVAVNNQEQFFKIIRAGFSQRRKTILNCLARVLSGIEKVKIQQLLQSQMIDWQARPEELSINQFARIELALHREGISF